MPRNKKLIKLRFKLLSKRKKSYARKGSSRKVPVVGGVICAKCGKVIPKGRKAIVVRKGVAFGMQDLHYHPACYKKIYKIKKR